MDIKNIQELLSLYFSEPKHVEDFSTIEYGLENEHYKITIDRSESYFVKLYRYRTEPMVSTELHLAIKLKELGLLTPQVITTLSGHLYTKYQGRYLALFEFIDGSHPKPTCDNLVKIGQAIAQIHQSQTNITFNAYQLSHKALFQAIRALSSLDSSLADFFHTAISVSEKIPFDKLPKSLTHCDIFLDNLLETKDNKLYVIDFEDAAFEHRLFDLSRAIIGCCTRQEMIDMTLCKALLKGYSMQCSLSTIEQEYLYEYIIYAGLLSTFWRYEEFNIKRPNEGKNEIYKEWMFPTIQLINMGKDCFFADYVERGNE